MAERASGGPSGSRLGAKVQLVDLRLREARLELGALPTEPIDVQIDLAQQSQWVREGETFSATVGVKATLMPVDPAQWSGELLLEIAVEHLVVYRVPTDLDLSDDECRAFVDSSAVLTSWPYAREIVQSLAAKAGFPQLLLPTFRVSVGSEGERADARNQPTKRAKPKKAPVNKKAAAKKTPAKKDTAKKASAKQAAATTGARG